MQEERRRRVLFVCTANRQRSPTAERLFRDDPRFEVDSAGTLALLGRSVTADRMYWADDVVVMEDHHAERIRSQFPELSREKRIFVLGIPDIYEYMEPELQSVIRTRFDAVYRP